MRRCIRTGSLIDCGRAPRPWTVVLPWMLSDNRRTMPIPRLNEANMLMKITLLTAGLLAAAVGGSGVADARSIKWARSGDALTLDPHAQNEGPTTNVNAPDLRAAGRARPQRQARSRRSRCPGASPRTPRCGNSSCARASSSTTATRSTPTTWCSRSSARASRPPTSRATLDVGRIRCQGRRPTPCASRPRARTRSWSDNLTNLLHHGQGVVGGEQRHQAAGLQEQGGELRGSQRQRHRPVRAGLARAGREDGLQAQRRLLGPRRGAARDHRAGADPDQGRTRPASPRCSPARSTSCRTCRCRTSSG